VNELYADVFARMYNFKTIGLRYFNVFGPRQNPDGAYAAVIPKWTASMLKGEPVYINGDGETSRDFCFIANAVQANLLAACVENEDARNQVYNVAVGDQTTLGQLFKLIHTCLTPHLATPHIKLIHQEFRTGDVRHSLADISKATSLLGYKPTHPVGTGLNESMSWYCQKLKSR